VNPSTGNLSPSEASRRLGVSTKALRLYETRGLLMPGRTETGWRVYSPREMTRAAEIVALRSLGLSLAQIARILGGDSRALEPALATHQVQMEGQLRSLASAVDRVRALRAGLAQGLEPSVGDLKRPTESASGIGVAFNLPWPWGGEMFELRDIRALTYIVGPLGSGKTRLAQCLAEELPGAAFLGLDRAADSGAAARALMDANPALAARVTARLRLLADAGATMTADLVTLIAELEVEGPAALVIDLVEQGLDRATQEALIDDLRQRASCARPLFLMTRSNAILDFADMGADEAIILCPANHSPPTQVTPYPGAPGYEAVGTCLASPDVRARTEGIIAWRRTQEVKQGSSEGR
jgi:DNA-binding transcriptional MerR regulator